MKRLFFSACLWLALSVSTHAAVSTVAITEFFNQPIGEVSARQWVELYNYGTLPMELKGWRIGSSGGLSGAFPLPEYKLGPGEYVIVLAGGRNLLPIDQAKRVFEVEWLSGKSESRILQIEQGDLTLGRGGGEISLYDRGRQIAWQLYYRGDGRDGHATFFSEKSRFRLLNKFGKAGEPGVVRDGNDAGITGGDFLGYEGNWVRVDPAAYKSDVSGLQTGFDDLYGKEAPRGQAQPGMGSPLRGDYASIGKK